MRPPSIPRFLAVAIPVVSLHLALSLAAPLAPAQAQTLDLPPHPRLIVHGTAENSGRLEELREQVDETGDPVDWSERKRLLVLAFRSLRAGSWFWYQRNLESQWGQWPIRQNGQFRCLATLALTDLLMKDKGSFYPEYSSGRIYAQKANSFLHWWREHGHYHWGQEDGDDNQLGYAELLAGYALFYDWCYDALSVPERAYHARAIYHMLTDEERLYHFSQGDWRFAAWYDNNHMGVIFGAAGLAALALDQDDPIFNATARDSIAWYREKAAERVRNYLNVSYPGEGAGIEGMLYAMYGMNLALPYALATQRLRTVDAGYDSLPASMRVDGPRNAFQTPTWLYYEQLPFNTCGATPLNDTSVPPYDLHPSFRAWAWLPAFSTSEDPNLGAPFFRTIYPPATIADAVMTAFDYQNPTPADDPFDVREPTAAEPECVPGRLNSEGILLAWPESASHPTLDPADLPPSAYFAGRGVTYFRTGVQLLKPDGTLDWKPDSCLITFECRRPPTYPPGYNRWRGHTQQDVNHFTLFFARQPLFYDTGYAGWGDYPSFFSRGHNLHQIRIGGGSWQDFTEYFAMGEPIGSVIGSGVGPSMAGGINTDCWSSDVLRSVRRMVVLPRPGEPAPYVLLHDDFELASEGTVRAIMHTANEVEGGTANMPQIEGNVARWHKEDARAVLAFLSPQSMDVSTGPLAPSDTTDWPVHWEIMAEVPEAGTRHQIVSLVEPRYTDDPGQELLDATLTISTSDPQGLAYQIDSGRLIDVVAFRPYDRTGIWWIYPEGLDPIQVEGGSLVVIRFDESLDGRHGVRADRIRGDRTRNDRSRGDRIGADRIRGGLLSGAGRITYRGRLIAAVAGDAATSFSFSETGSVGADGVDRSDGRDGSDGQRESNGRDGSDGSDGTAGRTGSDMRSGPDVRLIPNPLQRGDRILWSAREAPLTIGVYDVSGRLVRTLGGRVSQDPARITCDGRSANGSVLPDGLYFLRIRQGDAEWNRRVVVVQ